MTEVQELIGTTWERKHPAAKWARIDVLRIDSDMATCLVDDDQIKQIPVVSIPLYWERVPEAVAA